MSRSAFVERFTKLMGMPPIRYLTLWRLQPQNYICERPKKPSPSWHFDRLRVRAGVQSGVSNGIRTAARTVERSTVDVVIRVG